MALALQVVSTVTLLHSEFGCCMPVSFILTSFDNNLECSLTTGVLTFLFSFREMRFRFEGGIPSCILIMDFSVIVSNSKRTFSRNLHF